MIDMALPIKPKVKKPRKETSYLKVVEKKAYKTISRNTAIDFLKSKKPFQRIVYTPLGKELRKNKELNNAIKLLLEKKELNSFKGKNFTVEKLNYTKLKDSQNNTHTGSFKINIKINGENKSLFLKLYSQKDYKLKHPFYIELHKGHNEFMALEVAKQVGVEVIPAHLGFTNLKTVNGRNILESGIVYDFTNLQRLDKYLLKDTPNRQQIIEKHHRLNLQLTSLGVRDGFTKNVFIDKKTSKLYFFDLYNTDFDFSRL